MINQIEDTSTGNADLKTEEFQYTPAQQKAVDQVMLEDTIQSISNKLKYDRSMSPERRKELTERLQHLEADLSNENRSVKTQIEAIGKEEHHG